MDRMLYIGMSGAQQTTLAQQVNSNNIANANTSGFRADLAAFRSLQVFGPGYATRAYSMAERPSVDFTLGMVRNTDRDLDIAVDGEGWLAVQAHDGGEAYTRAGDLSIQTGGMLVNGSGLPVMGNGGPITVPQAEQIVIAGDGTISIRPIGQPANALVVVDRIKLVKPEQSNLVKGQDGLFRTKDKSVPEANADVGVVSGTLESSNVNLVDSLVKMISLSRTYEMQVKTMKTAEETDQATDTLLRFT